MEWIILILVLVLAFILGFTFCLWWNNLRKRAVGTLRIDRSDPDGPYLFLELDKPLMIFEYDEYAVFRIKNENLISQK